VDAQDAAVGSRRASGSAGPAGRALPIPDPLEARGPIRGAATQGPSAVRARDRELVQGLAEPGRRIGSEVDWHMPSRPKPSAVIVVLGAVGVVIVASVIGGVWGFKGFLVTCLVGSIVAGLLVTIGE